MKRAAAALAMLLLGGCAGSSLVAQWQDPAFKGQPPRGAKVMVACQAPDLTLRRLCADRLSEQLLTLGMQPLQAPEAGDGAPDEAALLQTARSAGAAALLRGTVAPETAAVAPAPSIGIGIGIGGFGGGYRSGGGVGIGVSAPIGAGGPAATGYGMGAALSDTASGQLMWSGRANAAPSSDVNAQLAAMAAQLLDGARQSGLFSR